MEVSGAYTHGDTVQMEIGLVVEDANHSQKPAMGTYYWDATDPLALALHFEVFLSAVIIDQERFAPAEGAVPDDMEAVPACAECDDEIEYETFGCLDPLPEPDHYRLLCLACGRDKPEAVCEEALWVFGLAEVEGALVDAPPAPAGAAQARVWRLNEENYQIALHTKDTVHILTLGVEELELMLCAIRDYTQRHGGEEILVDDYLAGGVAALERMLKKKDKKKKS